MVATMLYSRFPNLIHLLLLELNMIPGKLFLPHLTVSLSSSDSLMALCAPPFWHYHSCNLILICDSLINVCPWFLV